MISRIPANRRNNAPRRDPASSGRFMDLVRRRGGVISVDTRRLTPVPIVAPVNDGYKKPTKLLLNVNIERSLGPVQVVLSPERTVRDLIKAALEIYTKERRRPLLKEINPKFFQLHYSAFSLESLEREEKLINLCSRNFFLCFNSKTVNHCDSKEEDDAWKSMPFPLTKLMECLL